MTMIRDFRWTIGYLVVCVVLPFLALASRYDRWREYFLFYNHLLLYPAAYGGFVVALLECANKKFATGIFRYLSVRGFLALICVYVGIAVVIELQSPFYMEFEGNPEIVNRDERLRSAIPDLLDRKVLSDSQKIEYETALLAAVPSLYDVPRWPLARFLYVLSFAAQAAVFLAAYLVCLFLARFRMSESFEESKDFRAALMAAGAAIAIVTFWVIMRAGYEVMKAQLFFRQSSDVALQVIIILQLVAGLCVVACFWTWLGEKLVSAITLVVTSGGAYIAWSRSDKILPYVDGGAGLMPHMIMAAAVSLTLCAWFVLEPKKMERS